MQQIRFVSLNLQRRNGEHPRALQERMQHTAGFLLKLEPDVICVQEALPEAWTVLEDGLGSTESVFCSRRGEAESGEGVGIFWLRQPPASLDTHHFWFSDTPDLPSKSWKAAHPRVCAVLRTQHGETGFWWISLHLDHRSELARQRSLEMLAEWIATHIPPEEPLVIGGDFNFTASRPAYRELLKAAPRLRDATEDHPLSGLKPTFRGWGPFNWARARIDHCLHSRHWTCTDYRADTPRFEGRPLSDHRALVVDLSSS